MRNLKKFLALVLAMMMVFGLMVTANAADNADGAEALKYQQALDIIHELGVLQGYTSDGSSLGANDALQRGQLAAVLYRMYTGNTPSNGKEDKDPVLNAMKSTQVFDDVAPDQWYTGYVNYAYQMGWLKGYAGSNKFGPTDTLTMLQTLTGILRVLDLEDTSISNWEMATLTAAEKANLTGDFTYAELMGGASRQQLSQVALEGLTRPTAVETYWTVTAISNKIDSDKLATEYTTRNLAIEGGLKAAKPDQTVALDVDFLVEDHTRSDPTSTLGADKFGLVKSSNKDEYGRPATVYTVGDEVISSVEKKIVLEKDMPFTGTELFSALGNAKITVNQVNCAIAYTTIVKGDEYNTVTGTGSSAKVNTATFGANGVHVEIYEGAKADEYVAVVNVPTFTKITKIEKKDASVTLGAYTEYTLTGITGPLREYTTSVDAKNEETNIDIYEGAEEDDFVMVEYVPAADAEHWACYIVTPVDTIEGRVPSYTSRTKTWTVGSDSYLESDVANASGLEMSTDSSTRTVAVDSEENVIGLLPVEGADTDTTKTHYLFVLNAEIVENVVNGRISRVLEVVGITDAGQFMTGLQVSELDGTELTNAELASADGAAKDLVAEAFEPAVYEYEYEDGKYILTAVDPDTTDGIDKIDGGLDSSDELDDGVYASTKTKFYVGVTDDDDDDAYVDMETYTGYAAIGAVTADVIVAIDTDEDGIVDVVFLSDITPETAAQYAYILKDYDIGTGTNKYIYTAIVNGKETQLKLAAPIEDIDLPALVTLDGTDCDPLVDSNGTLAAFASAVEEGSATDYISLSNEAKLTYNGGWLMQDGATSSDPATRIMRVGANVPVYIFKGSAVTVKTASALSSNTGATILIATNADGNAIIAIYIVEDAVASLNGATVSTGTKKVPSIKKDQTVTVSGSAVVTITDSIEAEADVSAASFTNIKLDEGATCDEAVKYTGSAAKPTTADAGMSFTATGEKFLMANGNPASDSERTEYCFVFEVTGEAADVTITLTKGSVVLKNTDEDVTVGKHFYLVCPDNLNDGTEQGNHFKVNGAGDELAGEGDDNKLAAGYWYVSIDTADGDNLFTGGFTVPGADSED